MSIKKDLGLIVLGLCMNLNSQNVDFKYRTDGLNVNYNSQEQYHFSKENGKYVAKKENKVNFKTEFNFEKVKNMFGSSDKEKVLEAYYSDITNNVNDIVEYQIDVKRPKKTIHKKIYFLKEDNQTLERLAIAYTNGGIYFRGNDLVDSHGHKASYYSVEKEGKDNFFNHFFNKYSSENEKRDKVVSKDAIEKMLNDYKY
jgi:hypothetical protein